MDPDFSGWLGRVSEDVAYHWTYGALLSGGRQSWQEARDKLIKEKGVGKKDLLLFLSQDPCHQEAAGPWSSGKGSVLWVMPKTLALPNMPNELTPL